MTKSSKVKGGSQIQHHCSTTAGLSSGKSTICEVAWLHKQTNFARWAAHHCLVMLLMRRNDFEVSIFRSVKAMPGGIPSVQPHLPHDPVALVHVSKYVSKHARSATHSSFLGRN